MAQNNNNNDAFISASTIFSDDESMRAISGNKNSIDYSLPELFY